MVDIKSKGVTTPASLNIVAKNLHPNTKNCKSWIRKLSEKTPLKEWVSFYYLLMIEMIFNVRFIYKTNTRTLQGIDKSELPLKTYYAILRRFLNCFGLSYIFEELL